MGDVSRERQGGLGAAARLRGCSGGGLSGEGHENTVYELSGKLLTQEEIASALGEVLGKEVSVQHVDDAAYRDIMKMRVYRIF